MPAAWEADLSFLSKQTVFDAGAARYVFFGFKEPAAMEGYQIANLLELLIIAGGSLGGLAIVAWAWVSRRSALGKGEMRRMLESVETVRESVEAMRAEVGELSDRLEFTERMMARIAEGSGIRPGELPRP